MNKSIDKNREQQTYAITENLSRKSALLILVLIAVLTVAIRLLFLIEMNHTGLLYVSLPFVIAICLIVFTNSPEGADLKSSYWRTIRNSLIVLFGSSALLHEGFLCVLFVIPIYLVLVTLAYIFAVLFRRAKSRPGKLYSSTIPLLVLISSLEGVLPELTIDRNQQVSVSRILPLTPEQIKHNLVQPMVLSKSNNALLALFPMPKQIKAGSLEEGDIHEVHYQYDRWIFTNSHNGRTLLKVAEVSDSVIKMQVLEDTSYIAHYMKIQGTQLTFEPVDENNTRVTLKVEFERSLDPAWYFSPLEKYGVEKMSELILSEVINRD